MEEQTLKLEALKLAHECLAQSYNVMRENKRDKYFTARDSGAPVSFPALGKYPTPDEIVAAAEKFKTFLTT